MSPEDPPDYLVITSGFDEVSPNLAAMFPSARASIVDLYDPARTSEGSIRRARRRFPASGTPATPSRLPVADGSQAAIFAVFALHELRDPADRSAIFHECARALRPGGTLVLVEHLRDVPNIAAYGPGAWHFYPRREWLRRAGDAGLTVSGRQIVTPFVHGWGFTR